jgi:hypothetical protein
MDGLSVMWASMISEVDRAPLSSPGAGTALFDDGADLSSAVTGPRGFVGGAGCVVVKARGLVSKEESS